MALREISDADGVRWTIYEVYPSAKRGGVPQVQTGFAEGWICFQCEDSKRRLPGIPAGWDQLDDRALLALMRSATPVVVRSSPRPSE